MKLGCLFGLTAPMMLLCDFSEEEIKHYYTILNYSVNKDFLVSFRKELIYLKKSLDNIPSTCSIPQDYLEFTNCYSDVYLTNGTLSDTSAKGALFNEIEANIVFKVIKSVKDGECRFDYKKIFSCTEPKQDLDTLDKLVSEFLADQDISVISPASIATQILRKFRENTACSDEDIKYLCNLMDLDLKYASSFTVGGEKITLTDDEYNLLLFFENRKAYLTSLLSLFVVNSQEEDVIFGLPFSLLVSRKPASVLYKIVDKFEYTKNRNGNILLNVVRSTQEELNLLKSLFSKRVTIKNDSVSYLLSQQEIMKRLESESPDKRDFFMKLFDHIFTNDDEMTVELLDHLLLFYDKLNSLFIESINVTAGTNFTDKSFTEMIVKFNKIGICGINTASHYLFAESLDSIFLTQGEMFTKTQEEYDSFAKNLDNIQCLLDSIIPIGEEI